MAYMKDGMEEAIGKKWTKRIIVAATVIAVFCVIFFFAGIWPFSSAVGVAKRVTSPDRIIQSYEWFYDQYNAIQAQKRNIAILPEGSVDRVGTQMVLNNMIAEYNAKSREITRNLWKANDLPYQIGGE